MPSKISLMTAVLQADLDDTAALEVTNKLGQTRKSTIAQLRTAIVAGVLVAAHLTSPVIDSGGLTITSGTLGAQAVTATALTVTPGATSLQALTAGATSVTTLAGTGALTGFTTATFSSTIATVATGADLRVTIDADNAHSAMLSFRNAGNEKWLVGRGISSNDNVFRIYDATNGTVAIAITQGAAPAVAFTGGVSGITTLAGTGAVSGFTTYTGSGAVLISTNATYFQGKSSTAVTRDLIGMSAADKVRIDNNGIGADFGAGATFASGLTVSAGSTAVQALTATSVVIGTDPTGGGILRFTGLSRSSGASAAYQFDDRATGDTWTWFATGGVAFLTTSVNSPIAITRATGAVAFAGQVDLSVGGAKFGGGGGTGLVSVGAIDSGGAGFRLLRIPN